MTSFITAGSGQALLGKKEKARQLGITISSYKIEGENKPTPEEFKNFLTEFKQFCVANKNKKCDTLLFTGGHGDYHYPSFLNNLRQDQINLIVKTAKENHITFDHIVADCCCAPYGLNLLKGLLSDGGELIGDRTTSVTHWNHEYILDNIDTATDEKALMHSAINYSLKAYSAPLIVTLNDGEFTALCTTKADFFSKKQEQYRNFFDAPPTQEQIEDLFPGDCRALDNDLRSSRSIFPFAEECENRQTMIERRNQHVAEIAQASPSVAPNSPSSREEIFDIVKMTKADINFISKLDLRIFPDEEPLGDDRLRHISEKGVSSVIKNDTDEIIGYVFVSSSDNKFFIDNIGISPDYTRRGLASRLLNEVVKLADLSNKEIGLQVRATNEGAIALYQRAGFKIVSKNEPWIQMTREPQLVLQALAEQKSSASDSQKAHARQDFIARLESDLTNIEEKCASLGKRGEHVSKKQADDILKNLKSSLENFKNNTIDYSELKSHYSTQLDNVQSSSLANHRGFFSKIFNKILRLLGFKTDTEHTFLKLKTIFNEANPEPPNSTGSYGSINKTLNTTDNPPTQTKNNTSTESLEKGSAHGSHSKNASQKTQGDQDLTDEALARQLQDEEYRNPSLP